MKFSTPDNDIDKWGVITVQLQARMDGGTTTVTILASTDNNLVYVALVYSSVR